MLLQGEYTPDFIRFKQNLQFIGAVDLGNTWRTPKYVDNDSGVDGAFNGGSTRRPYKTVEKALIEVPVGGVIYIKPKAPDVAGGDPQGIAPATAVNWSIPVTKYGISLIGCGVGEDPLQAAYQTRLQGHADVAGVAPLTILAPYVKLENLSIAKGGATGVPLVRLSSALAALAFGSILYKVRLHMGDGTTGLTGAVQIDSHWYTVIKKCLFDRCAVGVGFGSAISNPTGCRITENLFEEIAADNYGDIVSAATAVLRLTVDNNIFAHAIPSNAGGKQRYLWLQGSSTGTVAKNTFATATLVTATLMTLSGLLDGGGNMTNRGWLTS